jgi:alpha-amylase
MDNNRNSENYSTEQYVLMQYFEWYLPSDGRHWQRLHDDARQLADMGVSGVWIPPCTKGTGADDVGYGVYDLFDLGEFDQKGTVRTKYGTRDELQRAIEKLHKTGLKVYADIVLNHKAGADAKETIQVIEVNPDNREENISEPFEIEAWTRFYYPARSGRYSEFQWGWQHFTATDYDARTDRTSVFKIVGENKDWSQNVDDEFGNYDYLMFADVDYHHPEVVAETLYWGEWITGELKLDGMRLDAIKHINEDFVENFVKAMRKKFGSDFYVFGEYWKNDTPRLREYLSDTNYHLSLVDVALHFNFFEAAKKGREYDLRKIFDNSLVTANPSHVVTFVDNHDSQKGQALESWVEDWFKPLAYALILLRRDGYPCLFYGDYNGIGGENPASVHKDILDKLLQARKNFAYGEQIDYFDHPNVIGWQRNGIPDRPRSGLAVIISNGDEGYKRMSFGSALANTSWIDLTENRTEKITLDEQGSADFKVNGGSVSAWVLEK